LQDQKLGKSDKIRSFPAKTQSRPETRPFYSYCADYSGECNAPSKTLSAPKKRGKLDFPADSSKDVSPDDRNLLINAAERNAPAVLIVGGEGKMCHFKSRLLATDQQGIWVELPDTMSRLVDQLVAQGAMIGVSFRPRDIRTGFFSHILSIDKNLHLNASGPLCAVLLEWPTELHPIQRRNHFRVAVPLDGSLSLRMWRIDEAVYLKDRPKAVQLIACRLRDISRGGIGVWIDRKSFQNINLEAGSRLRIELGFAENKHLLQGRVRHVAISHEQDPFAGIEFVGLDDTIEGRRLGSAIGSIVGQLQRREVQRSRGAA
jgi:c-di-GMP-binding flagellar brake protein YcgR